jgi:hypothetical protein
MTDAKPTAIVVGVDGSPLAHSGARVRHRRGAAAPRGLHVTYAYAAMASA